MPIVLKQQHIVYKRDKCNKLIRERGRKKIQNLVVFAYEELKREIYTTNQKHLLDYVV